MKYVYVLMGGCIDDYHIKGIFSSEKKAKVEEDKLKNDKQYHGEIWVEKWKVQ